jgi:hypothetical protein
MREDLVTGQRGERPVLLVSAPGARDGCTQADQGEGADGEVRAIGLVSRQGRSPSSPPLRAKIEQKEMKARMQIKPLTAKTKSTTSPMLLFNPTTPRRRRQPLRYAHG